LSDQTPPTASIATPPAAPRGASMPLSFLIGFTIVLFVYGWLSVNMYLPILPQLESVFDASPQAVKLTVTIFLAGFALAQLVWGPLSDRFGRRPVLLIGLAISVLGAALSSVAPNVELFMAARFAEALGLAVGPVVGRSVLTDMLDRSRIAITMAYVVMVVAIVPAFAPIVGGYLDLWLSWRAIFLFLALYGIGLWLLTRLHVPETIKIRTTSLDIRTVVRGYATMLRNSRYRSYLLVYGIAFGSLLGYYATTPYLFTTELGYSSYQYGYLLLFNVAFYVMGVEVSRFVVPKIGTDRPVGLAMLAYLLSTVMFIVLELFAAMDTLSVLVPMSVFIFGAGLVSPAANAGAMTVFRDHAGAATAFVGFAIAIGGALFSGALAHLHITRLWELGSYVAIITAISSAIYLSALRRPAPDELRG
jgi:MFS transporter, DHA1 family, multidrug resistance protein